MHVDVFVVGGVHERPGVLIEVFGVFGGVHFHQSALPLLYLLRLANTQHSPIFKYKLEALANQEQLDNVVHGLGALEALFFHGEGQGVGLCVVAEHVLLLFVGDRQVEFEFFF